LVGLNPKDGNNEASCSPKREASPEEASWVSPARKCPGGTANKEQNPEGRHRMHCKFLTSRVLRGNQTV